MAAVTGDFRGGPADGNFRKVFLRTQNERWHSRGTPVASFPMLIIGADEDTAPKLDLGEKIRELCEALLQDEEVLAARERVEGFLSNPDATRGYAKLANLSESLNQKRMGGGEISEEEGQEFESLRNEVVAMPEVQQFMEARGALEEIQGLIMAYVGRTLELGRVPTERDLAPQGGGGGGGSCGTGCGCH